MIYKGRGVIALLIPVCAILVGIYFFGTNGNSSLQLFLYSLLASTPILFILGIIMNKNARHEMWFIPVQYWGIIWAVIALVLLALKNTNII
ncbi:hypothetical protein ABE545_16160 [Sphingobacterium faecium]|jgi:hypothetical protein|uniref:hypothetical protein n=1 Tax=Sphingobacterium faecium TaxID=34087 RepID=UPI0032085760